MKNLKFVSITLFALILIMSACKKDEVVTPPPPNHVVEVTGTIDIPAGSNMDINAMDIVSPIDLISVSNGGYIMETLDNQFFSQFVYGEDERVMLMGYSYPGQTNFTIDSRSTALALLMSLPGSLLMAPEGKQELIQSYQAQPEFADLVQTIDELLIQDISPLDEAQTDFHEQLADFFDDVFQQRQTRIGQPLQVYQNGRNITFENLGKSYSTNVGVYRDGIFVQRITMEPINFVPTGIGDVIGAVAASATGDVPTGLQPQQKTYTIPNEGEYEFRVRNGFYTNGLDDDNVAAYVDNLINWNVTLFVELVPLGSCVQPLISDFREFLGTVLTFQSQPGPGEVLGLIYNLISEFMADAVTVGSCFLNPTENDVFLDKLEKLTTITGLVGVLGNAGNVVVGLFQWYTDDGAMDLCYYYDGNEVTGCQQGCPTTFTDSRDGQIYEIVQIGNQCWFAENLNYATGNSICYNDEQANCDVYGRMYDWYTAIDACPSGWHLPTSEEWFELINFLGGESLAGGKLKEAGFSHWNSPNAGASNSSGFTALPAGNVFTHTDGVTYHVFKEKNAFFWGSTEINAEMAWKMFLFHNDTRAFTGEHKREQWISCRCIKN